MAVSKDFTAMMKGMKEEYHQQGFSTTLDEATLEKVEAKKPLKTQKKGNLKEKNDAMMKLLNVVVERTEGLNEAWEHFASAEPAFANVASYRFGFMICFSEMNFRNADKTCPKGAAAMKNEAVAYDKNNLDGGMDLFEKQFDGVMEVKLIRKH